MQTWFILVRSLPVPTSSPQATHLRFSTLFVKSFYKVWITQGQPFPCVQESFTTRDPRSLNPFSEVKEKKKKSLLEETDCTMKINHNSLFEYASVWPRNLWEDKIFQFRKTLLIFWEDKTFWAIKNSLSIRVSKSHINRPLMAIHKNIWIDVTLESYFLKISSGNRLQ